MKRNFDSTTALYRANLAVIRLQALTERPKRRRADQGRLLVQAQELPRQATIAPADALRLAGWVIILVASLGMVMICASIAALAQGYYPVTAWLLGLLSAAGCVLAICRIAHGFDHLR